MFFGGFSKHLRTWGGFNAYFGIKVDRRRKGALATLGFLACCYIMWFMMKWCFIAMFWMFYGTSYLLYLICKYIYVYPIMWIVRKIKNAISHSNDMPDELQ
jgi:hypothetical protein